MGHPFCFMLGKTRKLNPLFGYGIAVLLLIAGIFSVWGFIIFLQNQAQQSRIKTVTVYPTSCTGWRNATGATELSLSESAGISLFSSRNSAESASPKQNSLDKITQDLPDVQTPSLVCSGFSVEDSMLEDKDLRSARIFFSVGAQADLDTQDILAFEYSLDGSTWRRLDSITITPGMSNAASDGYRRFDVSADVSADVLPDLQIRAVHHQLLKGASRVFVDAIGVELGLQKKLAIPELPPGIVRMAKFDFSYHESPTFSVTTEDKNIWSVLGKEPERQTVKGVTIHHVADEVTTADYRVETGKQGMDTTQKYVFSKQNFTKPGLYIADFEIEKDGVTQTVEQEFSWGVLAFNLDKSNYVIGETGTMSIAVLDDSGDIVCDADVELLITDPMGNVTKLSTDAGTIAVTDFCRKKEEFKEPDYHADYTFESNGTYNFALSATHDNGTFSIQDSVNVSDQQTFSVQRYGPTRVYPQVWQPMELRVTAYASYEGELHELVPEGFEIEPSDNYTTSEVDHKGHMVTQVSWKVNLQQGQSATFRYRFKPPDISPAFYVLGPLSLGEWQESRQWQLAIDPTYMYLLASTGTGVPSGWVLDTGSDGNYLRAAATAGGTGGHATHTHTFTETVGPASATVQTISGFGSATSNDTHTHISSGTTIAPANNDPAHYTFYLWKYNSADSTPPDIPQNTFSFFEDADVPSSPWVRFSASDNRLVKIDNSHTSGGSDTHTHAITWGSLGAASGTDTGPLVKAGSTPYFATTDHTHTAPASSSTAPATSVPQYSTLQLWEQTNGTAQALPTGMIALFDGTPPTGWTTISNASPYQDTYIRTTTSSGSTGGSSSHTHSNAQGVTGGPSATVNSSASPPAGSDFAAPAHTHTITLSNFSSESQDPLYENYVLASYDGATGIDISGNVLGTDESTFIGNPPCDGSTANVALRVNGGSASTTSCNATTGAYSFTGVSASAGDTVTIYLTGTTEKANLVMVAGSSNITDANLYEDRVIVRDDDDGTLSILDMLDYDNDQNATDMMFDADDAATDTLTVDSDVELHIWAGDTFDPNGTVTTQGTGDLHVAGTAYLDTATNTIAGQILVPTGGTLTISEDTNVNGDTNTVYVTGGTLNQTGGTLNVGDGTTENMYISGGSATFSGGTTNVVDEFDLLGGATLNISNTFNMNGSLSYFEIYGGSTANINSGADVNLSDRLYLHDDGTVMTVNNGSSIDSYDYWLLYSGTFNFNGGTHHVATGEASGSLYMNGSTATGITFNMTGSGTIYTRELKTSDNARNSTGTCTGGTIVINGDNPTLGLNVTEATNPMNFYNITIAGTTTSVSISTATIVNDFTVNSGQTFTTNNATIPVGHDFIIDGGTVVGGSSQISVGGSFTDNGTFTADTSTVTMTGTGNINGSSDTSFYNLTIGDATADVVTVGGSNDPTVTNVFDIDTGDTLTIGLGLYVTHTGGTYTLNGTVSGSGTMVFTSTSPGPGTTGVLTSRVRYDVTSANVSSTTFDARTYSGVVEVYSNSSSARSATMADSGSYTFSSDLNVRGESTGNVTLVDGAGTTVSVAGNIDYTGGGGGDEQIFFGSGSSWTVSGSVDFRDGSISANSSTFDMNGNEETIYGNSQTLNNFTISGTATVIRVASDLSVSGILTVNCSSIGSIFVNSGITLTLESSGSLNLIGSLVSIDGSGTYIHKASSFPSNGSFPIDNIRLDATSTNITIAGTRGFSNASSGDNVEFYSSSASARSIIFGSAGSQTLTFYGTVSSTVAGAGALTLDINTNDAAVVFADAVTLDSNTVVSASNSATMDIQQNWTNNGSFTHNSGTVRLSGTSTQSISGNLTSSDAFYTLQITNSSGSAVTINNDLTANTFSIPQGNTLLRVDDAASIGGSNFSATGSSGNLIDLRSLSDGNQWDMIFTGTMTADYVDVKDSNACPSTNIPVLPTNSYDSGNNSCWSFSVTVSGTSNLADGGTVRVAVNSTLDATHTGTISGGTWSISDVVVNSGDVITVWVDSQISGNETTGITKADGSATIAGLVLNANVLSVGYSGTVSLTVSDFAFYDSDNDEDIMHTSNSSTLDVDAGGPYTSEKFDILANATVTASTGETISTHDLEISPSAHLTASGTPAFNLSGTLTNAGDFNSSAETWTFTSSSTETINLTGASDYDMRNMTFNNASGNWSINRGLIIDGDLIVTSGTLTLNNDIMLLGGATGAGTITTTSGTPTFTIPNGNNIFGTSGTWTFYNLTLSHSGTSNYTTTATGSGIININNIFTLDATYNVGSDNVYDHYLEAGSLTYNLKGTGTPFARGGSAGPATFVPQTSTVIYSGTGSAVTPQQYYNYYNLYFTPTSTTTYNLESSTPYDIYNNFKIDANASVAPGTSEIYMHGTSGVLEGGGQDLYDVNIDPDSAGTITVQNSDVHVTNDLTVASGDTLSIDTGRTLTNSGPNDVAGTGSITGAGILRFTDTSGGPGSTISTLSADVTFDASAGNILSTTFDARTYDGDVLVYNGGGATQQVTSAGGTYTYNGAWTVQGVPNRVEVIYYLSDPTVYFYGDVTIASGGRLRPSDSATTYMYGNYTNNNEMWQTGGVIELAGTSQQILSGNMTGYLSGEFYNLTITNSSGANPDVIFAADADVANNFTASTASSKVQFLAGGTYTFQNMYLNGQAEGTRVSLTSSSPGTQWDLAVAGTRSVSNTYVRDSNACPQSPDIDASDGTNFDATNNDCWIINTLTFSISDNTVGFGTANAGTSRYATGDTNGSASEVEAHTLSISSNAENGYSLTVYGPTLTSGANTITAIGGINTLPNPGTEQFGLRMTASGGSGTVSAPYAAAGFAYDGASSPDEVASTSGLSAVTVYSIRYLLDIAATTDVGSYATDLTYIVTSNF